MKINPIPIVHKSHILRAKRCMKQLELDSVLKLDPEFDNESSIAGRALHSTLDSYHKKEYQDKLDDVKYWYDYWVEKFHNEKEIVLAKGIQVNTKEDIKAEDFLEMIAGYIDKPYNRYAEPILIETSFYFEIKKGRTIYPFAGRIDQLLKIKKEYLEIFFKDDNMWYSNKLPYIYLHRDLKTGKRRGTSDFLLSIDDNINMYSYALAYGLFDVDGDGVCEKDIHHIPYTHCIYFLRDHIKYKNSRRGSYAEGDEKGPAMYFNSRSLEDLNGWVKNELILLWKKVNSGIYSRDGMANDLCDFYCGHKSACMQTLKGEI